MVADVLAGASRSGIELNDEETGTLLAAADLVTLARTGVEFDYRGNVVDAHAPEMPTRFAKQLAQVVRGGVAVGMSRENAMRLAIRCARDSMPPMRLAIIDYLAQHPNSFTSDVHTGIDKPHTTVDWQLQALHMLGAVGCEEVEVGKDKPRWRYALREEDRPHRAGTRNVSTPLAPGLESARCREGGICLTTDKSGTPTPTARRTGHVRPTSPVKRTKHEGRKT